MKKLHFLLYVILLSTLTLQTSCSKDDTTLSEQQQFENEMTAALADAQVYGPKTQALALEVAEKFNQVATDQGIFERYKELSIAYHAVFEHINE